MNSDGFYGFFEPPPGVYIVRALPDDPSARGAGGADVTLASVAGARPAPGASGAGATDGGPTTFRVTGCTGGSLHYVATATERSLGSGTSTDGAGAAPVDGVYRIDISALNAGTPGDAAVRHLRSCAERPPPKTQTAVLFTDPSGTVVDDNAGGARARRRDRDAARLQRERDPGRRPAPLARDLREPRDERLAWRLGLGRRARHVPRAPPRRRTAATTTSGPLVVTPANPVDERRAPSLVQHSPVGPPGTPTPGSPPATPPPGFPPVTPPTTLPDPVAGVNFNVVPISGTVLVNGVVLPAGQQIPFGATIDAKNGIVSITTIGPNGLAADGVLLRRRLPAPARARRGHEPRCCTAATSASAASPPEGKKATKKATMKRHVSRPCAKARRSNPKKVVRALWGTGKGSFRTSGRFSSATVRGTLWYTPTAATAPTRR